MPTKGEVVPRAVQFGIGNAWFRPAVQPYGKAFRSVPWATLSNAARCHGCAKHCFGIGYAGLRIGMETPRHAKAMPLPRAEGASPPILRSSDPFPIFPSNFMSNISFHVTNLTARDANFLSTLIALFTDPANDEQAQLIRDGQQVITYSPVNGAALLADLEGIPGAAQIGSHSRPARAGSGRRPRVNGRLIHDA
jgi:hypothetical protein